VFCARDGLRGLTQRVAPFFNPTKAIQRERVVEVPA
jgi:hypothetical protein